MQSGKTGETTDPLAVPLSFGQERLWFLDRLKPETPAYNMTVRLDLHGPLDRDAVEAAVDELVRRHEILRTTYRQIDGEARQVIHPPEPVDLPLVDLSETPPDEQHEELERVCREEATEPFDLETGPISRFKLIRVAPDEHVLLANVHHIAFDGASVSVLRDELAELYEAHVHQRDPNLPKLPYQYADYAVWQHDHLQGDPVESAIESWRERLDGVDGLDLPTDRPRSPTADDLGGRHRFELPADAADRLDDLTRDTGASLFMVLLAAFKALLRRHTRQEDILVGTGIDGRPDADAERLVGFFVNTLLLRTDVPADATFRDLIERVRETCLEAYDRREVPYERLVAELDPDRDPARDPLLQVMFNVHDGDDGSPVHAGDLEVEQTLVGNGRSKFDLALGIERDPSGLSGVFKYNAHLFEAETVERMAGHFRRLVQAAVEDPDRRLRELEILGPDERARVVETWNATDRPYPEVPVHELFERQVERAPDRIAVRSGDDRITYGELDAQANRLAHVLRDHGVRRGDRVAICLERGPDLVAAQLAVLKAGAAYVPLDPAYPSDRLAYMLEDASAAAAVVHADAPDPLPTGDLPRVTLDEATLREGPAEPTDADVDVDDLAYIMYTSGSTGRPKGVRIPHRGIVRLVHDPDYVEITPDDTVLQFAPASFDAATFEVWAPLANGARLASAPPGDLGLAELGDVISEHDVTVLWLTAPLFHAMVDRHLEALDGVEQLLAGGDVLSPEHVERAVDALDLRVINGYGPTENTTFTTTYPVTSPDQFEGPVPIGTPISNTRVYVLDDSMDPVPIGVPGELYTGGDGLADGYVDRPELSERMFVPDPLSDDPDARLYRTGDLARWRPDGTLEFLGRIDDQVKVRGFRIEPGEVESHLTEHGPVDRAVVVPRDRDGTTELVGYVATDTPEAISETELRRFLAERVPDHMVPGRFVVLDELPLTPNGKVDRGALPEPADRPDDEDLRAPRSPVEQTLAEIWADVLDVDRVGIHDDFFELGGHSLLATQVVSRVRDVFEVEVSIRDLFDAPTVAGLADAVAGRDETAGRGVAPADRGDRAPVSFAQQRLWFIDRFEDGRTPEYNVPYRFRLQGDLDVDALEWALKRIVDRHEVLRTTYVTDESDDPVQVVHDNPSAPLEMDDLSDLPPDEGRERAREIAREEADTPFDLEQGPVHRFRLVKLAPDDHVLLSTFHHVAFDGWSFDVLRRELRELYTARRDDRDPRLPELAIQYADYAVWQRERLQGELLEAKMAYWEDKLADVPTLELPTDHPRPPVPSSEGSAHRFDVPRETVEGLESVARAEGASLFMTSLAAFKVLLSKYSRQDDLSVGTPTAGRDQKEIEDLIGFFVNTLALRTDLSGDPTFRDVVRRVRETCLEAYAHDDVPFEKLVAELEPERDLAHDPLFQVMFSFATGSSPDLALPDLESTTLDVEHRTAKFDLSLGLSTRADGWTGDWTYRTDLFEEETIETMTRSLRRVMEQVAEDPDRRLSDVTLPGSDERRELLAWGRGPERTVPDGGFHQLFEAQAQATPDRIAVEHHDETLTYAELDARANRIAYTLLALGVTRDDCVATCMDRCSDQIAAILGILKAGGCYLPVEPDQPAPRIRGILEDADATAVLTRADPAPEDAVPKIPIVDLERDRDEIASHPSETPSVESDPADRAYIIYTSGSTGRPKGVVVEHRSTVSLARGYEPIYGDLDDPRTPRRTVALNAPLSFDASVQEIVSLLFGHTLRILDDDDRTDSDRLREILGTGGLDVFDCTPSQLRLIGDVDVLEQPDAPDTILVGGEAIPSDLASELAALEGVTVLSAYGPTEATVDSVMGPIRASGRPVLGEPMANERVYVVDEHANPVPAGVPGELCIGGEGVARGYLDRPDLTAEKFVPDRFADDPDARMYRTGDLARWRPDGTLEFLGRKDLQVQVRGHRVEPGEIETVLERQDRVDQAVVVADEREDGTQLTAYAAVDRPDDVSGSTLRRHLERRLPDPMVPTRFVVLETFPLKSSGKVDRDALPEPEGRPDLEERYVAPRTQVEEVLVGIWKTVLDVDRIGVHDDFFELGGHSLLATKVLSQVRDAFGVELDLQALFERSTVAALAERIQPAVEEMVEKMSDDEVEAMLGRIEGGEPGD